MSNTNTDTDKRYYALVLVLWLVYVALYLKAPLIGPNSYNLSHTQLAFLKLTVALPFLIVWSLAASGAIALKRYVKLIAGSTDGQAFSKLGKGLAVLVIGLITTATIGQLQPYAFIAGHIRAMVILNNYLQILFPLAAFYLMYQGSRGLTELVGARLPGTQRWGLFMVFAALAPLYTWLVFHNPNRTLVTTPGVNYASHYLPDIWILLTIVMPNLIVWALGALTVLHLRAYSKAVQGLIYRAALKALSNGFVAVVLFSIMLQFLTATSGSLVHLKLNGILAIIYFLIAFYAAAYVSVALGARQLSKIEQAQ